MFSMTRFTSISSSNWAIKEYWILSAWFDANNLKRWCDFSMQKAKKIPYYVWCKYSLGDQPNPKYKIDEKDTHELPMLARSERLKNYYYFMVKHKTSLATKSNKELNR